MGLDLLVEARAKPGHEAEWREIMARSLEDPADESETARFQEISTPPYECVGAPRVGEDAAANAWIIEKRDAKTRDEIEAVLKEFDGYYALSLLESDGLPKYSHGGLYQGVDETSFRGAFLQDCVDVLSKAQIESAWDSKMPEAAVDYGRELLSAAEAAAARPPQAPAKKGFLASLGLGKKKEQVSLEDQLDIVRTAGRWYIFWGERGHAIRAWS